MRDSFCGVCVVSTVKVKFCLCLTEKDIMPWGPIRWSKCFLDHSSVWRCHWLHVPAALPLGKAPPRCSDGRPLGLRTGLEYMERERELPGLELRTHSRPSCNKSQYRLRYPEFCCWHCYYFYSSSFIITINTLLLSVVSLGKWP
jgi:hypothetical protein